MINQKKYSEYKTGISLFFFTIHPDTSCVLECDVGFIHIEGSLQSV